MNKTERNKKSGYLVALLLVVGLAAFSNSMRELAEIHRFTFDTGRLVAHYFVPAEIPQTPQIPQVVVAKLDSCDSRLAVPSVEVAMAVPALPAKVARVAAPVRVKPTEVQLAKIDKFRQFEFHTTPFEFKISTDDNDDSDTPVPVQLPVTMFKAKNRKHNVIRINPRDREMILRTLNRSINVRTAS